VLNKVNLRIRITIIPRVTITVIRVDMEHRVNRVFFILLYDGKSYGCSNGAGGFIGSHLVKYLKRKGYWVRGVDLKHPEFGSTDADEFKILDLRRSNCCLEATRDVDEVYALRRIWEEWDIFPPIKP
jgi:hypothetical protein